MKDTPAECGDKNVSLIHKSTESWILWSLGHELSSQFTRTNMSSKVQPAVWPAQEPSLVPGSSVIDVVRSYKLLFKVQIKREGKYYLLPGICVFFFQSGGDLGNHSVSAECALQPCHPGPASWLHQMGGGGGWRVRRPLGAAPDDTWTPDNVTKLPSAVRNSLFCWIYSEAQSNSALLRNKEACRCCSGTLLNWLEQTQNNGEKKKKESVFVFPKSCFKIILKQLFGLKFTSSLLQNNNTLLK